MVSEEIINREVKLMIKSKLGEKFKSKYTTWATYDIHAAQQISKKLSKILHVYITYVPDKFEVNRYNLSSIHN